MVRDYRINQQDVAWAEGVIKHLKPTFGKMAVSSIRPRHVDRHIEQRLTAGAAPATINHELSMIRRAFNLAREKGTLGAVPFTIPKLAENNTRKGFFEHSEYRAMRDALPAEVKPVLTFAYYTGCRKGEILALRWSQVDLAERLVRLEPGETKNDEARIIPLVPELYQTLAMQRTIRDEKWPDCPWVFFREGEKILYFRKSWDSACKAAGLWNGDEKTGAPSKLFHDLRRTGVRNLVRAGVPETVAMRISGHKTRSIFDRYNITSEADIRDAGRRLGEYMATKEPAEPVHASTQPGSPSGTQPQNWHTIGTQKPSGRVH